jgi:hypothetical protein
MKCNLVVLAASTLLLTACAHTNFTEYRGPSVVAGKGGTVKNGDGIDIWENGDPDRKYQILGVIDDSRGTGVFAPEVSCSHLRSPVARTTGCS